MQNLECHTDIFSPFLLYHYAVIVLNSPLPALHNPFLVEYSSCSLSLSSNSSLSFSALPNPTTPPTFTISLQISLHLFLSPNQFPYKCKKRSTETNFVSHSSVTSVMLCPQAGIYKSRTIGLITSAKDKLGKDEETLSLREKKCTVLYDMFLSLSFM